MLYHIHVEVPSAAHQDQLLGRPAHPLLLLAGAQRTLSLSLLHQHLVPMLHCKHD